MGSKKRKKEERKKEGTKGNLVTLGEGNVKKGNKSMKVVGSLHL